VERFDVANVRHSGVETFAERTLLRFEDPEGQRLVLADDGGAPFEGELWDGAGIPAEHAIRGFYGITLSVPRLAAVGEILLRLLGMEAMASLPGLEGEEDRVTVFAMDGGGPGREVFVLEQPDERPARLGRGGVHHVAFRLRDDEEQRIWLDRLNRAGVHHSGIVDRFYFKSLYFRISVGILFELATDGPGFTADEPLEALGERLALPPFLEPRRQEIEAGLRPLSASR
jgi:glyoxalase family protein